MAASFRKLVKVAAHFTKIMIYIEETLNTSRSESKLSFKVTRPRSSVPTTNQRTDGRRDDAAAVFVSLSATG